MEHLIKAVLLGIAQGLTEFLPVSSSGHLVIFSNILNFQQSGITFEVFVHLGTLVSVLIALRSEIGQMLLAPYQVWVQKSTDPQVQEFLKWDYYVIVATLPAVFVGLFFKDAIEQAFTSVLLVYGLLMVTGLLMFATQFLKDRGTPFKYSNTLIIGIAQSFAILPGISRSGSTIFAGMAQGMDREKVARFSFILSIPAILGAAVLNIGDMIADPPAVSQVMGLAVGTIASGLTGYLAIVWLLKIVRRGKLQWFGYYCFGIGILGIIWYFTH